MWKRLSLPSDGPKAASSSDQAAASTRFDRTDLGLSCSTAALTEFLPETLAAYPAVNPDVHIDLEERPSYQVVQAVAEGLADVGIVADSADLAGLESFPFRVDRLVLVVPRGHPLAKRRRLAFHEVTGYEFVGLSAGSTLQDYLDRHAARAGQPLKLRVRLRGFEAVCRTVEHGVGLAVVRETAALGCRRAMAIRMVRLTDAWALRNLTICVRRADALPAHARRLVEHLATGVPGTPSATGQATRQARPGSPQSGSGPT